VKLLPKKALFALLALAGAACSGGVDFDARVEQPAFPNNGPKILFDQGHHNHHRIGSSYQPFGDLLRSDGFSIDTLSGPITRAELQDAQILAIVTAQADTETNAEPAFTAREIAEITNWVRTVARCCSCSITIRSPILSKRLRARWGWKSPRA
jgi:hypothetical protein